VILSWSGSWIALGVVFVTSSLVSELQDKGIHFRSLTDSDRYQTPAGRFFFHVMSALAEMERELIVERTRGYLCREGAGRVGGRRRVMTEEVVERCRRMLENGATRQQVADVIGVDVKTIYKYLPAT
jgi:DNA invertase Pin-like site-specific DNA recombinase